MNTDRDFVNDYDGMFNELPKDLVEFTSESRLKEMMVYGRELGFGYPVTFATNDVPTAPDKTGWDSGQGTKILDHVFFFEDEMTLRWAQDILTVFQSCSAFYIGLEQKYDLRKEYSTKLDAGMFSPEELSAWMCLFWNSRSKPSFEPRDLEGFPNAYWFRGYWIPRK